MSASPAASSPAGSSARTPWRTRRLTAALIVGVGLLAAFLALAIGRLPLARSFEWTLYDLRMRRTVDPAAAPRQLVMVEIDEQTLREMEPLAGRWPWPRVVHSLLVDFFARAPARLVVYDVLFLEHDRRNGFEMGGETVSGADSDQAFVDSVARAGNVILLADATYGGERPGTPASDAPPSAYERASGAGARWRIDATIDERPVVTAPFAELARAARGIGHNLFVLDDDGPIRRIVPFVRSGERVVPSLAVAAWIALAGVGPDRVRAAADRLDLGDARLPLLRFPIPRAPGEPGPRDAAQGLIRYRGPALRPDGTPTYRTYAANRLIASENLLLNDQKPLIDPAELRDAIVFVGVTAAGGSDVFATPLGSTGRIPGSQIHGTVVDQLMTGRTIQRVPLWIEMVFTALVGLATAALTVSLPLRVGAPGAALAAAGVAAASLALFARGNWLSLVEPLTAVALAGVGGLAWQYFVEGREKRQVKQLFSRYVSKDVYDQVLRHPELAELGGKRRTMSVLFSDVRGFTAITERGDPEALVAQLNEYFSRMVEIVFAHHGTLDKFVGDMVMALFGAPLDDQAHADHAVSAAIDMVQALSALNRKWQAEGRPPLGIGIGVNSGEMIAGNIGAETVRSYTVIGDAVNLGARLESLNKDYGTTIIISDRTAALLTGRYNLRALGPVTVKGKSIAVEIFEVVADFGSQGAGERPTAS
jgi:adenylate cyclase